MMDAMRVCKVRSSTRTAHIFDNDCEKLNPPWYGTPLVKGLSDGLFADVDATSSEADAALFRCASNQAPLRCSCLHFGVSGSTN